MNTWIAIAVSPILLTTCFCYPTVSVINIFSMSLEYSVHMVSLVYHFSFSVWNPGWLLFGPGICSTQPHLIGHIIFMVSNIVLFVCICLLIFFTFNVLGAGLSTETSPEIHPHFLLPSGVSLIYIAHFRTCDYTL